MRKSILLLLFLCSGIAIDLFILSCAHPCGRGGSNGGAVTLNKVYIQTLDPARVAKDADTLQYVGDTAEFVVGVVLSSVVRNVVPSFVQSAYACQPAEIVNKNERDTMVLVAVTDFDSEHPAGSNLNDLVDFGEVYREKYVPATFYSALQVNMLGRFVHFSNERFYARLLKAPLSKSAVVRLEIRGTQVFDDEIVVTK